MPRSIASLTVKLAVVLHVARSLGRARGEINQRLEDTGRTAAQELVKRKGSAHLADILLSLRG